MVDWQGLDEDEAKWDRKAAGCERGGMEVRLGEGEAGWR